MIRVAMILAMLATPVLGDTPKTACDWLARAELEATLGAPVTLTPGFSRTNAAVRVSLCTATTEDGDSLALLYRDTSDETRSPADLVAAYRDELASVMNPPPNFEELDLGLAALWEATMHQLTVWSHEGKVMMVFTLFGPHARERCIAVARSILEAGG
ncbi:hypothetical protein C8J27_101784 [Rhodobacter aestuarii]|uniref:Uncharacterized protein n=1 Tax=Rhodobacter aestuarii TaxID=453582 RepID=A0A1N7P910_9RHOB|nr:hypothetical protein [Rhodobacter aestuarii]PTV97667.1 hypothetical protein C8J27_101784 [Rhodobacter aestuarii]SIT07016.1 hypothetical protein SAMN05421580_109144 [Rhodobacter aestuarii]